MEHTLDREGCRLHYWLAGPADRPLVVFTHGVMMDHRVFEDQVATIAREYRVLVWDVRGHGLSRPYGDRFSIGLATEDLAAILDQVGAGPVILVGHSMGGLISQEFAFRYPDRVRAMATIGIACLTCKYGAITRHVARIPGVFIRFLPEGMLCRLTGWAAGTQRRTRQVARAASRAVPRADRVRFWREIPRGFHYEPGYRLNRPLLVTLGPFDVLMGLGGIRGRIRHWARVEPQGRYAVIPGAGHNAHQDNPGFFNALLLDFLRENGLNKES